MNSSEIVQRRLSCQYLNGETLATPQDVVRHFGAVQAQEYADAKWALGLRLTDATDAAVERALSHGDILRTHIMRPTWHFVHPADIRWLTALTAPRVKAKMAYYNRQLELDEAVFARSHAALEGALSGGKALTRDELSRALEADGVGPAKGQRLGHLVHWAELEALVTSGPRRGKQFTHMLLEERVAPAPMLTGEEALAELTRRYFTSHGPATPQDFAWWSGLTVGEAKRGLELVGAGLEQESVDGTTFTFAPSPPVSEPSTIVQLLPWFDEYTVAYTDRSLIFGPEANPQMTGRDYDTLSRTVLIGGKGAAFWKRTLKRDSVRLELRPFREFDERVTAGLEEAIERFRRFFGVSEVIINQDV